MSTFKGTLVVAGMCAVAGLGCSHYRSAKTYQPSSTTTQSSSSTVTTPATPAAPQPSTQGTEMGTGGAGIETPGLPQSTPSNSSTGEPQRDHQNQPIQNDTNVNNNLSVTPPSDLSTQPGTGGSGLDIGKDVSKPGFDVKNPDMKPDNCNRNQIGSPNSSDVI
jgi:hypothetical protein